LFHAHLEGNPGASGGLLKDKCEGFPLQRQIPSTEAVTTFISGAKGENVPQDAHLHTIEVEKMIE
jgi:hypothetical protein